MADLTYHPPSGDHPVGVRDGEVLDTAYPVIRQQDSAGRRIMVRVWYPADCADPASRGPRRPYVVGTEGGVITWCLEATRAPVEWLDSLETIVTYSVQDAPVAPGEFPTIVFSHGAGSWVSQNTPLMEHHASHGYVVWAITHPGESSGVQYLDGTQVRYDDEFMSQFVALMGAPTYMDKLTGDVARRYEVTPDFLDENGMGPWQTRWVDDMRAVIDALFSDEVLGPAAALVPSCDLAALGVAGMSFGVATASSVAHLDHRVKAGVNLDGGQHLSDLFGVDVRVPLLHLATDIVGQLTAMGLPGVRLIDSNEFFFEEFANAGRVEHLHRLRMADVTHLELTDFVLLPAGDRTALPGGGVVESQRMLDLFNTFIGDFFDEHLKGVSTSFPVAQMSAFPEVTPIDVSAIREWALEESS